jgi:hypothetical protein
MPPGAPTDRQVRAGAAALLLVPVLAAGALGGDGRARWVWGGLAVLVVACIAVARFGRRSP